MRDRLTRWSPALVALVAALLSLAVYPRLPAEMTTHWTGDGTPNGWMPRGIAAFLLPAIILGVGTLLRQLPAIDPRRENYERFAPAYARMTGVVLLFLLVIHAGLLAAALGYDVPVARAAPVLGGALFVAIGNVLPTLRSNFWFGIRTPWTLSDDRVWARTHRVAGFMMTGVGLLMIAGGILLPAHAALTLVVGAAIVATFGPALYSYFTWKRRSTP